MQRQGSAREEHDIERKQGQQAHKGIL
jgi:hypothetical protein